MNWSSSHGIGWNMSKLFCLSVLFCAYSSFRFWHTRIFFVREGKLNFDAKEHIIQAGRVSLSCPFPQWDDPLGQFPLYEPAKFLGKVQRFTKAAYYKNWGGLGSPQWPLNTSFPRSFSKKKKLKIKVMLSVKRKREHWQIYRHKNRTENKFQDEFRGGSSTERLITGNPKCQNNAHL